MGFIFLSSGVLFDATNEEGQLLHTKTGTCLALDPLATLILQVALSVETKAHALARLASHVDATNAQLEEGFQSVLNQLLTLRFLSITPSSDVCAEETGHVPFVSAEVMNPLPRPVSKDSLVGWEFFLTGRMTNGPLPHLSLFRRGYAFWKTGEILLLVGYSDLVASVFESLRQHERAELLRQREWEVLVRRLSRLKSHQWNLEADLLWRMSRRELVFCQMLVRLLAPTGACLVRSIAFCTYLRALGLPAQVVIGRACFDLSSHYSFHAWTELAGIVVNDHAELQSGFAALQRFPEGASVPGSGSLENDSTDKKNGVGVYEAPHQGATDEKDHSQESYYCVLQPEDEDLLSLNQKIVCCVGGLVLLAFVLRAAQDTYRRKK